MLNKSYGPAIVWWGQIVNDEVWKGNLPAGKWKYTDEIPGYGTRYRVAILGRDSQDKDTPDDKLEWADVLYPVTAGSGHGGSYETANLRKGAFVFGIYRDGIHMTQPVIMGCLGNNEQIPLSRTVPLKNFVPFSGYIGERVSVTNIPAEGSSPPVVSHEGPNGEVKTDNKQPGEGANSTNRTSLADQKQLEDGNIERSHLVPTNCDKIQLGRIQIEIRKFIADIQKFKSLSWLNSILKPISENGTAYSLSEYILYKAQSAAKIIASGIRGIINFIQRKVKEKINSAVKRSYFLLHPNLRPGVKTAVETANDLLACLFRKIISNLIDIVINLLLQIAERFITVPLCAVESIISNFLGQILGLITGFVTNIIQPIEALVGGVIDLALDVLSLIEDVLSFLSCDEKPDCPSVVGWTPWVGATTLNFSGSITNIFNKAKGIATKFQQVTDIDIDNFDFNLDFAGIFEDTCNVGPVFCGPPTVEFLGGGGNGARGNAIISLTGDILGIDIVDPGYGYTSPPLINFVDSCGKGSNASGIAILGPVTSGIGTTSRAGIGTTAGSGTIGIATDTGDSLGVIGVRMGNPGSGYISSPDGDRGGDGNVWATRDQATVKRVDETYDRPYNPGETFPVYVGDELYFGGVTTIIQEDGFYTVPFIPDVPPPSRNSPSLDSGNYPVFLELDNIYIDSPGINYNPEKDRIIITPDNGAKLNAVFDSLGSLQKVNVIKAGIGFTEMPKITIETESGYNAILTAGFKVNRVGNIPDGVTEVPPGVQVINVVDCVGKFYG